MEDRAVPGWMGLTVGAAVAAAVMTLGFWWAVVAWLQDFEKLAAWVQAIGSVAALAWGAWLYSRGVADKERDIKLRKHNIGVMVAELVDLTARELEKVAARAEEPTAKPFLPLAFERLALLEEMLRTLPALESGEGGMVRDAMTARSRITTVVRYCNEFGAAAKATGLGRENRLKSLRRELRTIATSAALAQTRLREIYPSERE